VTECLHHSLPVLWLGAWLLLIVGLGLLALGLTDPDRGRGASWRI